MASVSGRKKSVISTAGLSIDTPVATNGLLNKAASQSTSLYQQCSALRSRLMLIRGFPHYFNLATPPDSRQSTDPVTQLWDLFALGIPLCYIFDLLPASAGFNKINNSSFTADYDANPDRAQKRAIALFAMQIRTDEVTQKISGCELFTVTDLWDRKLTDGLVKVINTVTAIVDHLQPDVFEESPPSPPTLSSHDSSDSLLEALPPQPNGKEAARNNIVREIVETERKFVQDLEIMQKYSNALSQANLMDQDTIHLLFPNLNKLLNFQRKFLIRLESTAELPWQDQRWGQHFLESEDEFVVYEPYCANYINATELMLANEESLVPLNHLINVKGELPAFLIKPIQRVCKYPLLLDSLIKASSPTTYQHFDELKRGSDAAKRITDKINEAQRRAENEQTVKSLQYRIDDWKGHHLENFGELLLDDIFVVTKSDIDREYHVFLFEKIILCCKEAPLLPQNGRNKVGRNNPILKKGGTPPPLTLPGGVGQPQKKTTPLLLKGRIFLGNVTQAVPVSARISTPSGVPPHFPLAVWWKGDDDLEFFTLRCRREEQMRQWEAQINRLIKEAAQRKASDRPTTSGIARIAMTNSTNPLSASRHGNSSTYANSAPVSMHHQPSTSTAIRNNRPVNNYNHDDASSNAGSMYSAGPQGYPPHDGFDFEPEDEEDYEDYPPVSAANYPASGRGTPMGAPSGARRNPNALSMPLEREPVAGYDRPRAQTESTDGLTMAQWRNGLPQPPSNQPSPAGVLRPITPRMNSNVSANSYTSDASFGNSSVPLPLKPSSRPPLRSQASSNRLKNGYDASYNSGIPTPAVNSSDYRTVRAPTPTGGLTAPPMNRSRSASQPSAYVPKTAVPPPMPSYNSHWSNHDRSNHSNNNKRGSGSSQSTGDSSEYSPNSSSPVTPFGSSESSLGGVAIRNSRTQTYESTPTLNGPHNVKVKVHFHEDIFVIQVSRTTEYEDLVEKVGRKIRLCGPRRDDGPLRVKYKDEDGDMVSLGSTEDVQMAFEQGGQVTLFVT